MAQQSWADSEHFPPPEELYIIVSWKDLTVLFVADFQLRLSLSCMHHGAPLWCSKVKRGPPPVAQHASLACSRHSSQILSSKSTMPHWSTELGTACHTVFSVCALSDAQTCCQNSTHIACQPNKVLYTVFGLDRMLCSLPYYIIRTLSRIFCWISSAPLRFRMKCDECHESGLEH